jgi:threonine/homoserine/homoserine lactone efflux protein
MQRAIGVAPMRTIALIGAAVLILIGASMLRARKSRAPDSSAHAVLGFVIVATNPGFLVAWTGFAALLASFGRVGHVVPTAIGAAFGIVAWFLTLFALVARFRERFTDRTLLIITRVLGVVVIGFGVALAIIKR